MSGLYSGGVVVGTAVGIAFGLGGLCAEIPRTYAMGTVMFFLVPFGAGFAIATVTEGVQRVAPSKMGRDILRKKPDSAICKKSTYK
jgi:hypothetical protein